MDKVIFSPLRCPYPCGWDALLNNTFNEGAIVINGLVEGEPVSGDVRRLAIGCIQTLTHLVSELKKEATRSIWVDVKSLLPNVGRTYIVRLKSGVISTSMYDIGTGKWLTPDGCELLGYSVEQWADILL